MMTLSPVKSYKAAYPNQYEVDLKPLLLSAKPRAWASPRAAAIILCTLAAAGISGCASKPTASAESIPIQASRKMDVAPIFENAQSNESLPAISKLSYAPKLSGLSYLAGARKSPYSVMPLGNGPGAFMMEYSALAVISEELAKSGLTAETSSKKVTIAGAKSTPVQWSFDLTVRGGKEPIYIEYMPYSHSEEYDDELNERTAAGLPEDSLEAAKALHDKLLEVYDESAAAVFYDDKITYTVEEDSNLTAQVAEFVEWLKAMGLV